MVATLFVCTALVCISAHAEQPAIPRIGVLAPNLYDSPIGEGLREGLRKQGCIEGENIVIERRRSPVTTQGLRSSKFIAEREKKPQ